MTHDPISPEFYDSMNNLAGGLDSILNPDGKKCVGFALLTYKFGEEIRGTGRVNYIGNGARADVLIALKELVARWEGRYSEPEKTQ